MIKATNLLEGMELANEDDEAGADDDVDQYVKLRMLPTAGESNGQCSASNQQQQAAQFRSKGGMDMQKLE